MASMGPIVPGTPPARRTDSYHTPSSLVEFVASRAERLNLFNGRSPTADLTRSRWPLAPEWLRVQQATLGHRAVGLRRLRLARHSTSIAKLLPGLTGYLA